MTREIITTVHHLYPKSRWWTSEHINLLTLRDWVHRWIHQVFSNQTPQEQLLSLLSLNSQVLRSEVKKEVIRAIMQFDWYIYKRWVKK